METINVRYGATLSMQVVSDDPSATDVTMYIGKAGESPLVAAASTFNEDGQATINLTPADTALPLGEYSYQLTVITSQGAVEKYPEPDDCDDCDLPKFIVHEALDEIEVVS